jgi:hypothetical protein
VNKEELGRKAKMLTHKAQRELVKQFVRSRKLIKQVAAEAYERVSQGAVRLGELKSSLSRKGEEEGDNDRKI